MGGGSYYNHGLKTIFPGRFLAVSLHMSILQLQNSGFGGLSKIRTQSMKIVSFEIYKGKIERKNYRPLSLEGHQTKPRAARAFNYHKNQ